MLRNSFILTMFLFSELSFGDSFEFNSYNNHGVIGLVNMPSARFLDEGSVGITLYDGTPDQKITLTTSPFNWLETSVFYANFQGRPSGFEGQDFKDKGFNIKLRIREEDRLPAIALGINDIAGTGFYSSEYIVASYGIANLDLHFGLGWGKLNGSNNDFRNPLINISDKFGERPSNENEFSQEGGQFQASRYFSDKTVSPFYGLSYVINKDLVFKIEHDTTLTPGNIGYEIPSSKVSASLEYRPNKNFSFGLSRERDNYFSLRFNYKFETLSEDTKFKYKKTQKDPELNTYSQLVRNLESNNIVVNKIREGADTIGLEITQFAHPSLDIIEEIIMTASQESGIDKEIKTDYRIVDLQAYTEIEDGFENKSVLMYEREEGKKFFTNNSLRVRPFIAAREGFLKLSLLFENDTEYLFSDNFTFSSNLKYSLIDNFDDLTIPPVDTFPEQVRSDVKDYLRNFDRLIIGRAQFDYFLTPKKNNHIMMTAGILEEMFNGYGFEYLYYDNTKNYAFGLELFNVQKRDYGMRFGTLDYKNTTGFASFYYRNYNYIPFDAKISYGKYLAGDIGTSLELSRTFINGTQLGVFATFTDVSSQDFGEGSFDKGIFFNIPIYKNFINYSWRPLTKDPGQKLVRKNTLYDLLVRFKPIN